MIFKFSHFTYFEFFYIYFFYLFFNVFLFKILEKIEVISPIYEQKKWKFKVPNFPKYKSKFPKVIVSCL